MNYLPLCEYNDLSQAIDCQSHETITENQIEGSFNFDSWELISDQTIPEGCFCSTGQLTILDTNEKENYMVIIYGLTSSVRYLLQGKEGEVTTNWQRPACMDKIYRVSVYRAKVNVFKEQPSTVIPEESVAKSNFPYPLLATPLLGLPFLLGGNSDAPENIPTALNPPGIMPPSITPTPIVDGPILGVPIVPPIKGDDVVFDTPIPGVLPPPSQPYPSKNPTEVDEPGYLFGALLLLLYLKEKR